MNRLAVYVLPIVFLLILVIAGCEDRTQETRPKLASAKALEHYFKNESTLKQAGWGFYATQIKGEKLFAYLTFPQRQAGVSRTAPVESELRRLCPDGNLHTFWPDTKLDTFELVLIKNVKANKGKAKRLLQITCDSKFNLVAFEKGTIETKEPEPILDKEPEPILDVERDREKWYVEIITALREDDPVRTERLVEQRPQYIDMRNDRGESLLHFCKSGATARLLLDKGAKVDAKTQWGATPLIYAAGFPTTDFASVLIAAGADVNQMDKQSATPLRRAHNLDMAMLLIEHGAGVPEDALLEPAATGQIGLIKYLHDKGAIVGAKNRSGETPLHRAASRSSETNAKGHVEVAQWLIQQDAEVNALDVFGKTPYDATIWNNNPNQEMLKLLAANGGKPAKKLKK